MLLPFLIERPWKKYAATLRTGTGPAMSAARDVPTAGAESVIQRLSWI